MIVTFTGNGSCTTLYDDDAIEIDVTSWEEAQKWATETVESLPDGQKDQFGDIDPEKVRLDDLIALMPKSWNARKLGVKASTLFV